MSCSPCVDTLINRRHLLIHGTSSQFNKKFRPLGKVHNHNAQPNSYSPLSFADGSRRTVARLTLRPNIPRPHLTKRAMSRWLQSPKVASVKVFFISSHRRCSATTARVERLVAEQETLSHATPIDTYLRPHGLDIT